MPVSIVVGGQYGSEGKGKVALHIAQNSGAPVVVVRVGGPNSGHSGVDATGKLRVLRQLPAASLCADCLVVLPAGSLIDPEVLKSEVEQIKFDPSRLIIDENATVVTQEHRSRERSEGLVDAIGSTGSGTGAALTERISRVSGHLLARDHDYLKKFTTKSVSMFLRETLSKKHRIVVEGTQGFGLSIWHSAHYPFATSRDTTASGFLAEAGLSPFDVDDVVLVIRTFPIRVGGNSGPLENEIDWPTLALEASLPLNYVELTSATRRVRRVGRFHPEVVLRAIAANLPSRIVLNHLDYIDPDARLGILGRKSIEFIEFVERSLSRSVSLVGVSPETLIKRNEANVSRSVHANSAR